MKESKDKQLIDMITDQFDNMKYAFRDMAKQDQRKANYIDGVIHGLSLAKETVRICHSEQPLSLAGIYENTPVAKSDEAH